MTGPHASCDFQTNSLGWENPQPLVSVICSAALEINDQMAILIAASMLSVKRRQQPLPR
jgi:hypothetical protein